MKNHHFPEPSRLLPEHERLLKRRLLRRTVPVSDMTIWRWERDGRFPRHVSIYGRNYWILSQVERWVEDQKQANACLARKEG